MGQEPGNLKAKKNQMLLSLQNRSNNISSLMVSSQGFSVDLVLPVPRHLARTMNTVCVVI